MRCYFYLNSFSIISNVCYKTSLNRKHDTASTWVVSSRAFMDFINSIFHFSFKKISLPLKIISFEDVFSCFGFSFYWGLMEVYSFHRFVCILSSTDKRCDVFDTILLYRWYSTLLRYNNLWNCCWYESLLFQDYS